MELEVALDADGRGVKLAGAAVEAGATYALQLDGLRDRSGNDMWPLDLSFTAVEAETYETVLDAAAPSVLAVIDAADGLYVLFDEPVVAVGGAELSGAVTVARSGTELAGTTERLGAQLLKWTPAAGAPWYPQQRYQITQVALQDLAPSPSSVSTLPGQFMHLATYPEQNLVAWSPPDHSERIPQSRFGLTSLFQGRTWHDELGLYYFRARWYGVNQLGFLERDPVGFVDSNNIYAGLGFDTENNIDPHGKYHSDVHLALTAYLSEKAGFSSDEARKISLSNQLVDVKPETHPIDNASVGNWDPIFEYHFPIDPDKNKVIAGGPTAWAKVRAATNTRDLGIGLHVLQDSYSHSEAFRGNLVLYGMLYGDVGEGLLTAAKISKRLKNPEAGITHNLDFRLLDSMGPIRALKSVDWTHMNPEQNVRSAWSTYIALLDYRDRMGLSEAGHRQQLLFSWSNHISRDVWRFAVADSVEEKVEWCREFVPWICDLVPWSKEMVGE